MANPKKMMLIVMVVLFVFLLSSCLQQETPIEKIYKTIEQVAIAEKDFEQVQDPLVETEKKEKAVYNQMIELDTNQSDERAKLSSQALKMVNDRKKYMNLETESLQNSEKEFKKVAPLITEINDKKVKKQANELYRLMNERYRAHEFLSREYLNGISQDRALYEMFKNKSISLAELGSQIDKINLIYKNIYTANDKFNLLTKQYNEKKLLFYKSAGLVK